MTPLILPFNAKLRRISGSFMFTIPKALVTSHKLEIGQIYNLIIRITETDTETSKKVQHS